MEKNIKAKVLDDVVVIAGHPRSGTSLACQLVESAGVSFPSDYGADKFNKHGYYELQNVNRLSQKLIKEAMTNENTVEMNKAVDKLNAIEGSSGLKIVKIPALFFYKHVAKRMRVIFIFRNPADVKASMLQRGISSFELDWFTNNNALIAGYENIQNSILISYETILQNQERVAKIFNKLGLEIDPDVIQKVERTQVESNIVLKPEEEKLYQRLKELEEECFQLCGIE